MNRNRRAVHTALAVLLSIFLLAACGGEEEPVETETSPTTGDTGAFEISGTVQQVEVEGATPTPTGTATATPTGTATATPTGTATASPTGTATATPTDDEESPTASPTATGTATPTGPLARLVVEIESINAGPAELCGVEEGDTVTLTVTNTTAIEPQQSLEDLEEIEGRTIRAEGNAEELAEEDRGGTAGGAQTATPTPTGTATATPTGTATATPTDDDESPTASPTATGTGTPTGTGTGVAGIGDDAEQACHFDVAILTIEDAEDGETPTTGIGDADASPTPAPAGGQGNIGDTGDSPSPVNPRTPAATPTSAGGGT